MGAEAEEEKMETKPNPISEAQFLSWKRRKDEKCLCGNYRGFRRSICVDKDPCVLQPPALHMLIKGTGLNFHDAEASARKAEAARKRSEDIAAGTVQMNGRELFQHEPWVFDNTSY